VAEAPGGYWDNVTKLSVVLVTAAALIVSGFVADTGSTVQASGLIAYSVSHPMPSGVETGHICLLDPSTGRTQRLTHERYVFDYVPAWSPAGVLAFTRRFYNEQQTDNIFTIHSSRTTPRLLQRAGNNLWPSWSPDGKQIVYATGYHGFELRVMNADGSGVRSLGPSGSVSGPAWSPDGTRILYSRSDFGNSVWVVGADGRGDRMLIENAVGGRWSPDGGRIVFLRSGAGERLHLWVATADGASGRPLTAAGAEDRSPSWSADATEIVFERNGDLHVIGADGTAERRLTTTRLVERYPAWSGQTRDLGHPACSVLGGAGGQRLSGTPSPDYVYGGGGDDEIRTGGGRDVALGEAGADQIHGGSDSDALGGGPGADRLYGDAGPDVLYGGPGADLLVGGAGSDGFRCGPGRDTVILRGRERAARDCERRIRLG
jgi:Ca2+-binding RTX toxin-like protein